MSILTSLKFVQGAVAKKDYQPALTHFRIADGRVVGYNGIIALSSPIDLDIQATPKATPFVKAIERCKEDTTVVHVTDTGKLSLKSGRFRAYVECHEDACVLESVVPEGTDIALESGFLEAIRALTPFVGTDASRPWATGILLDGHSAYATNNIVLVEYWIGATMPGINLPSSAIQELNRIGEEPVSVKLGDRSITFFFEGGRWMRSQLLSTEWPNVSRMLDVAFASTGMEPIPPALFECVDTLVPFVADEGRVYFRENKLTTVAVGEGGASMEIEGLPDYGAYHHKHLASLNGVATDIDFYVHPNPCPFLGKKLRGVLLGMIDA